MMATGYGLLHLGDDPQDSWMQRNGEGPAWPPCFYRKYPNSQCDAEARFVGYYDSLTGQGAVAHHRRDLCAYHAERFAKRHGLEVP